MPNRNSHTRLVVAGGLLSAEAVRQIESDRQNGRVVFFALNAQAAAGNYPLDWVRLPLDDVLDVDKLCRDFLSFVERWPNQSLRNGKTFEQLFRRRDGYSTWWTGPGIYRQPLIMVFPIVRVAWLLSRVLMRFTGSRVLLLMENPLFASVCQSKLLAEGCDWQWLAGSAMPGDLTWVARRKWLIQSVGEMLKAALKSILFRKQYSRGEETKDNDLNRSTVVLNINYPRHLRVRNGRHESWYWREATDALAKLQRPPDVAYLLGPKTLDRWRKDYKCKELKRREGARIQGLLVPRESHFTLRFLIGNVANQTRMLVRYFCLERSRAFRTSFRFCNADLAPLYVPYLRQTLREALSWELSVMTVESTLKLANDARVVLVDQELHPTGAIVIAACRRLGIATVGVQHGHVYPLHMMYTLPAGQVAGAPVPDYLAVYSDYTRDVISQCGNYPRDRIWVTGSPRFDWIVNNPPDQVDCRRQLGLFDCKHVLVVATKRDVWTPLALQHIVDAAREQGDVCVCIKPWAKDGNQILYQELVDRNKGVDVRVVDAPFEQLLAACDSVASICSTTLLEATLMGKPSISLNYTGDPERYPYATEGVSINAATSNDVSTAVAKVRSFEPTEEWNSRRASFLTRHLGPNVQGRSAETLAKMLADHFLTENLSKDSPVPEPNEIRAA